MRLALVALASLTCWTSCSGPERGRSTGVRAGNDIVAPGLRLPDDVTPVDYDLRLDIDPDQEIFRGEVAITIELSRTSDHVWLHMDRIELASARWTKLGAEGGGTLVPLDVPGEQMRAFRFGQTLEPGRYVLSFTYTGRANGDQEGLFRQRDGAWYVFSQGESVFARRITPCFDEPRWKTPWKVTLVVPKRDVALANMPETLTTVLADGNKEIVFQVSPPMPSYLLALAVGPFDLIEAGSVGRNRIPVRVAVRAGEGKHVGVVAARLPSVVAAVEDYLDDALPLAKLDLVAVPAFFGAMENPGLITFHEPIVVGNPRRDAFAGYFMYIAAHELVHQWFGNLITPAWWDHLWLSEAFASWLGDKVVRDLGAYDDAPLRFALSRREAIAADTERDAKPLWRHVTSTIDTDEGFDAIAYAKGQLVLATFESFVGEDKFRDLVRGYVKTERGHVVTSADLVKSLGVPALEQYAASTGTPVVSFSLSCTKTKAELVGHSSTRVPTCIAYATPKGPARACALVGDHTALAIGDACPAWVEGNPDGGYYHVAWTTQGPRGPARRLAELTPASRIIVGDDLAAAVRRGELTAADALSELRELIDSHDVYAQLGAATLARALDTLVDDANRPAWVAWLAGHFGDRLAPDRKLRPADSELTNELISFVPPDQFPTTATRRAYDLLDRSLPNTTGELPAALVALASVHGGDKLFDRIASRARLITDDEARDTWLEGLGELPASQISKAVALVTAQTFPPDVAFQALARYLERPSTRTAAWHSLVGALPAIRRAMPFDHQEDVIGATVHLCDAASRDQVHQAFAGDKNLTTVLQTIDRCIAARAKLGDLDAALAATK